MNISDILKFTLGIQKVKAIIRLAIILVEG